MDESGHYAAPDFRQHFRDRLLQPGYESSIFVAEELLRPWMPSFDLRVFGAQPPLGANGALRVMDQYSQSQLAHGRIVAPADTNLDTRTSRHAVLGLHATHGNWTESSPLISADACPHSTIARARRYRSRRRGPSYVSLINNMVRLRFGYPAVSAYQEMLHYQVPDPYNGDYEYYRSQILYPYAIFEEEIVGTWDWSDVENMIDVEGTDGWTSYLRRELRDHEERAARDWAIRHPIVHLNS